MKKSVRRALSTGTVLVLTSAMASAGGSASGASIRTDTDLGGFSIHTDAAPFKVLLDDPTNPIPRDLDTPIVEADPAYSEADLSTGPAARGLGAVLWPGGLLGEGVGTATNGAVPGYPLKAEGRYPDNPHEEVKQDNGAFMRGSALGLDVLGTAKMNPADVPGTLDVGVVASTSTATVKDGVASGKAVSRVADVSLLIDTIKVREVSTTVTVESNGKKATSTGSTVVSGLEIGGVGYAVDENGAHPVGPVSNGTGPLPALPDPAKALGISISAIRQVATKTSDTATRDAGGLQIVVDTKVLRGVLDQTPSPITDALYSLFAQAPKELQGNLYYALAATPKITFILGAGTGRAAAALPLSFDFPEVPVTGGLPPVTGPAGAPGPTTSGPLPGVDPGSTGPAPTVVQPPLVVTKAAAKDPFKGVSPGLLLLVALAAAVAGWGLSRLQAMAMTAVGATRCDDGTSPSLPDLRGE
jgi:hypothetical protein